MSKRLVKRVKRGCSPPPAVVGHPDVTEEDVARAAGMVPGLNTLAGTVRHIFPGDEMDVAMAQGWSRHSRTRSLRFGVRQLGIRIPSWQPLGSQR